MDLLTTSLMFCILLTGHHRPNAACPPAIELLDHAIVYKHELYYFSNDARNPGIIDTAELHVIPVANPRRDRWKNYQATDLGYFHSRHHITDGVVWFASGATHIWRVPFPDLVFFDSSNDKQSEHYRKKYPSPKSTPWVTHCLSSPALYHKYIDILNAEGDGPLSGKLAKGVVGVEMVPTAADTLKIFLQTRKARKMQTWETQFRFVDKEKQWKVVADKRNPELFDSLLIEDFYAFARKNDYYFVTQSGKLYHAPPAKKGEKSRKMAALWDDAERPINAIIEDADNNKVWLFAKNTKDARRGYYFEMNSATTFENFDPTKLKRVNIEGRARMLLELLPLIRKDNKK